MHRALFAELDAGHPVLVLQDLGVGPLHVWHYAVVIGYEAEPQQVVLRSGVTERLVMPYAEFVPTWRKSGEWAAVILAADVLPATASAEKYVESIVPVEALGHLDTARTAYATALARWPDNLLALFGLANTEHQLGQLTAGRRHVRTPAAARTGQPGGAEQSCGGDAGAGLPVARGSAMRSGRWRWCRPAANSKRRWRIPG